MSFTILLSAAVALAPAPPTRLLSPSTSWSLAEHPTVCRVDRSFGRGSEAVGLRMIKSLLTGRSMITVELSRPVAVTYGEPIQLVVEPDGREETGAVTGFPPVGSPQKVMALFVRDAVLAKSPASAIRLKLRGATIAHLAVGDLAAALAMLRDCEARLVRELGIDADGLRDLSSWPVPLEPMETWFTPDSYPPAAIRAGAQGRVGVRFTVAADGSATDCALLVGTGNVDLDGETCRIILARARYEPARDRDGRAVPVPQILFMRWILPGS